MARVTCILTLLLCFSIPAVAQSRTASAGTAPTAATIVIPAPSPEPADTAMAGEPLIDRVIGGALVGAVTGAALSGEDADCASDDPVSGAIAGGFLGLVRAVFRWRPSDVPRDPTDDGVKGPYPFDGESCEPSADN